MASNFAHRHKICGFLRHVHSVKRHFSSSSSSPGLVETTNSAEIEEIGLHDLAEAQVEWKREKDAELLARSQRAKLAAVRRLHDFLLNGPKEPSTSIWAPLDVEGRAECDRILAHFEERMAEEMKKTEATLVAVAEQRKVPRQIERELDVFKNLYLRVLFRLFREVYRLGADEMEKSGEKGVQRQRAEKAQVERLNAVFDLVPEMTELKRHCFLGVFWLSDGQSFRFLDHLNTKCGRSSLDGPHVNFICHIAIATKEAPILEPLTELATFLPSNFLHLAKVFNSLALIYGQTDNFDKLEELWRKLDRMKSKVPFAEQRSRMKPILARIAHFFRIANRTAPGSLQAAIRRLDGQPFFISAHAKKREENT
uniref:Uncharacterized protein n=1 Tax=Globodera pallida TaxID=36090 RepID=A0A183BSV0_GLOPA